MEEMIRVSRADGSPEGWISTDLILTIGTNQMQRFVGWRKPGGEFRESVVAPEDDHMVMSLTTAPSLR